jgi:hypothetical protein
VIRTYKTKTGTYNEKDLAVIVWKNPKKTKRPNSRQLETMTSPNSRYPMAFPIKNLIDNAAFKEAKQVKSSEEFFSFVENTSRNSPVLLDLPLATVTLGWSNFYIPEEYVDGDLPK